MLMPASEHTLRTVQGYQFIEAGASSSRPPIVLLHGMLGDLSNWARTIRTLADHQYRVLVPVLPVYDLPMRQTSVSGLVTYVRGFLEALELPEVVLAGNSLGGHVALLYALEYPDSVCALVLSGASGIYEVEIGTSMLRRRDREFLRKRAAMTFYDPEHVTEDLLDDVVSIVNDRGRALRLIRMARSVQAETVTDRLPKLDMPTLLVWGKDDLITPPSVAHTFEEQLQNATLHFIDECGHAPMMEHPDEFNRLMLEFLRRTTGSPALAMSS